MGRFGFCIPNPMAGENFGGLHVLPFARTGSRFSPGLATAVLLFYPIGIACYWRASHDGTLRMRTLIGSLVLGALLMASPIVLLKIKNLPYFRRIADPGPRRRNRSVLSR
jgi:hypothetical protein